MKVPRLQNINRLLIRHAEIPMALAIVCLVGLLIIRVPQSVIDVLIALNIGISVTILLTAFYIPDAAKLPSFPTILLLTTLFRLALNVSTTRLILLEANAGKIINAFGNFVVEGNFIVGGVVFIVLVVIQFIVIAKGAERVAEVSARFTLDAMPGKQMAIDYDLNKGSIDPAEGKRRRDELASESKLYSAMDGAMKFVKGDAIASIIIAVINILGGLAIGILQQGMSAADALQVYSVLTIGDGLVSQIPALLISVSAGLVVTRVASSDGIESNVGRDIVGQILAHPKGLLTASGLMAVIGATGPITGLPMIPFLVLATIGGTLSILKLREPVSEMPAARSAKPQSAETAEKARTALAALRPLPLALEVHKSLLPLFPVTDPNNPKQRKPLADWIDRIKLDLGIMLPPLEVISRDPGPLPPGGYSFNLFDVSVATSQLSGLYLIPFTMDRLARGGITAEKLASAGITPTPVTIPWNNAPGLGIPPDQFVTAIGMGIKVLPWQEIVAVHLRHVLFRYSADFLGVPEVGRMLKDLEPDGEDLVKAVIGPAPAPGLTLSQITDVLKNLLREQVSIRNLPLILESLARWGRTQKDTGVLAEFVRLDCRRAICAQLTVGPRVLTYHSISRELEDLILSHATPTPQGEVLGLRLQDHNRIIDSIRATVTAGGIAGGGGRPVVGVNGSRVRRLLRQVIEQRLPDVAVLSYEEMAPEFEHKQLGSVSLPD